MSDEPIVLEFGRYRLFETPDGGWLLRRAVSICDRCQGCGCGEQSEPVVIPGMIVALAKASQSGGGGRLGGLVRRLNVRGDSGEGGGSGAETPEGRMHARRARSRSRTVGLPAQTAGGEADPGGAGTAEAVR